MWMYQTSSDCAAMTETAAININFSFWIADLALDKICLTVVLYTHGINNLPANSTDFSNLSSFKRGLNSSFQQDTLLFITFRLFYIATHYCFYISILLFLWHINGFGFGLLIIIIITTNGLETVAHHVHSIQHNARNATDEMRSWLPTACLLELPLNLRGLSSHPVGGVLPPETNVLPPVGGHQLPPSGEECLFCNCCSSILSRFCGRWCCG